MRNGQTLKTLAIHLSVDACEDADRRPPRFWGDVDVTAAFLEIRRRLLCDVLTKPLFLVPDVIEGPNGKKWIPSPMRCAKFCKMSACDSRCRGPSSGSRIKHESEKPWACASHRRRPHGLGGPRCTGDWELGRRADRKPTTWSCPSPHVSQVCATFTTIGWPRKTDRRAVCFAMLRQERHGVERRTRTIFDQGHVSDAESPFQTLVKDGSEASTEPASSSLGPQIVILPGARPLSRQTSAGSYRLSRPSPMLHQVRCVDGPGQPQPWCRNILF